MPSSFEVSPESLPAAACPTCGANLTAALFADRCPRCGNATPVSEADNLAETQLQIGAAPALKRNSSRDRSAEDALVGRDLDVYRLETILGRGGMGTVFLATHRDLHRRCALKVLAPQLIAEDSEYINRFFLEGRATAALVHPNIITVHALGETEGYYFLEMEYVPGSVLSRQIEDTGRLSPVRATLMAARIAEALAAAHHHDVIHRDVKPDNVMVTLQGVPKLTDFGLAKRLSSKRAEIPDGLCGTPGFIAPELYQGTEVTPASDIFSLGVSYYYMLTGELPFRGTTLLQHRELLQTQPIPSVRSLAPEVPLEMAECAALLLDRTPANRPRSGFEAAQLLNSVLGHLRDLDALVRDAFQSDRRVTWKAEADRYKMVVEVPMGRRQEVYLQESDHAAADRLIEIYTTCCPAQAGFYESALRLNGDMPHGSVALREVDGKLQFVVVDTYPRATIDAEEIRRSTHEVAARADAIEHLLTGQDRN